MLLNLYVQCCVTHCVDSYLFDSLSLIKRETICPCDLELKWFYLCVHELENHSFGRIYFGGILFWMNNLFFWLDRT